MIGRAVKSVHPVGPSRATIMLHRSRPRTSSPAGCQEYAGAYTSNRVREILEGFAEMTTVIKATIAVALMIAAATASAQGDPKRGEKLFENCRACHAIDGAANEVGPGLRGVFGRRAGERDDFRYSPALKKSGIAWTPKTMDAFVADPQKAVPANRMPYSGMPDAGERADLIAFMLQAFK